MGSLNLKHGEAFSVATLFYMRLRRVNSRVIDVIHFIENKSYALHIIDLAEKTSDTELLKYIEKLKNLLNLNGVEEMAESSWEVQQPMYGQAPMNSSNDGQKVSEEEIYKAQVSHHYIGALR